MQSRRIIFFAPNITPPGGKGPIDPAFAGEKPGNMEAMESKRQEVAVADVKATGKAVRDPAPVSFEEGLDVPVVDDATLRGNQVLWRIHGANVAVLSLCLRWSSSFDVNLSGIASHLPLFSCLRREEVAAKLAIGNFSRTAAAALYIHTYDTPAVNSSCSPHPQGPSSRFVLANDASGK